MVGLVQWPMAMGCLVLVALVVQLISMRRFKRVGSITSMLRINSLLVEMCKTDPTAPVFVLLPRDHNDS